jgi:AraC family transcriptional regulator
MPYNLNQLYPVVPREKNNAIVFSKLSSLKFAGACSPAIGIKYVLSGEENYFIEKKVYNVTPQNFLLVNAKHPFSASIPANQTAVGLCIDVSEDIIKEVHQVETNPAETLLDNGTQISNRLLTFFENIYPIADIFLGSKIALLTRALSKNKPVEINAELFYLLAYDILQLEKSIKKKIQSIESKKASTREELYRRVLIAKHILDDCVLQNISLDMLAAESFLSKYHLTRIFKKVFKTSPHQYHLQKKMEYASRMLKDKNKSIGEIARQINFPDKYSFSKSFKKVFNISPGKYRNDFL